MVMHQLTDSLLVFSADFDNPTAKQAYEDGYTDLLTFFQEHL